MIGKLVVLRKRLLGLVDKISWLGPLLARITVGVVFMGTGWGKLHDLEGTAKHFAEWGIPMPHFNAVLASSTEFFGGLCVLVGLATRLAALPLAFTMLVAIVAAKRGDIDDVSTLLGFDEFAYLVMFLWLALAGPGKASLDALIAKLWIDRSPSPAAKSAAA
jgi:putative oxidoreductase